MMARMKYVRNVTFYPNNSVSENKKVNLFLACVFKNKQTSLKQEGNLLHKHRSSRIAQNS